MSKTEMPFEEAITRLDAIVKSLEDGRAPLDSSLALFEEGVGLVKLCGAKLDAAEQKIKVLTGDGAKMTEADFNFSGEGK